MFDFVSDYSNICFFSLLLRMIHINIFDQRFVILVFDLLLCSKLNRFFMVCARPARSGHSSRFLVIREIFLVYSFFGKSIF